MQQVCVLGLGYIGLPTASVLATNGFQVLGVDLCDRIVDTVNSAQIHIEEPGLHTLVQAAIGSGNLRAARHPDASDIFIIAVPTPLTPDKKADMSFVIQAAESIVPCLRPGALVILESTSPPGTCRDRLRPILEESGLISGESLFIAHCPERVLPGKILHELIRNDRVIGGLDATSAEKARELYASFVEGEIFLTDATTAEMVKLLENTYRDVNIALANEAAVLCERLGIDFWEAARYANRHPRVKLHAAGPGVGGHCISVDPWFLAEIIPDETPLIRLSRQRNDTMPGHVAATTRSLLEGIETPKVAVLGLAYKGNVDDIRESPAIHVVELLNAAGIQTAVHDPHVHNAPFPLAELNDAIDGADMLLLLTNHDEFKTISPEETAAKMRCRLLYDTRNALPHAEWRAAGFDVRILGSGVQ